MMSRIISKLSIRLKSRLIYFFAHQHGLTKITDFQCFCYKRNGCGERRNTSEIPFCENINMRSLREKFCTVSALYSLMHTVTKHRQFLEK